MAMQRPLDLTLISAKDLKDVNFFSKMEVYAEAWLSGDPRDRQRTATDRDGGKNPSWNNATLRFCVPDGPVDGLLLHVLLRCERALGDRDVGEVHVPVRELVSTPGSGKSAQFVSYEVRRPSGKPKGILNFSYKFGEPVVASAPFPAPYEAPATAYPAPGAAAAYTAPGAASAYAAPAPAAGSSKADVPVTAYPAGTSAAYPAPGASYPPTGYPAYPPPPPQPYGYGAPPPQGYGYPPPPAYGYGAPPVVQPQPPKKNKFGMGLGAGLLGGALGGLLIGDMVSDAADFDDGFGF